MRGLVFGRLALGILVVRSIHLHAGARALGRLDANADLFGAGRLEPRLDDIAGAPDRLNGPAARVVHAARGGADPAP